MASVDDLWRVDFGEPYPGEPAKHRPALILGPAETFGAMPFVILAPLTTTHRNLSLHVEVEPTQLTGLAGVSYVQCELVRSVSDKRLVHRLGSIDPPTSVRVAEILKTLLNY